MCGVLTLESTVLEYDGPGYSVAKKLVETYEEDKKKGTNLLDSHSAKAAILQNRTDVSLRGFETPTPKNVTRETEHVYTTLEQFDETLEDDTEDQTITGGKNVSWIVDKKNRVIQMLNDITEEEKETANNIEQEIKSLLHEVISRDINMSKKKLNQRKGLNDHLKENSRYTLASAKDCNSQKEDDKRRSAGKEIDAIITLKDESC
ncbi:13716_t:CDS:2 [Rhizophagus irregularis]|nr:13716_t:CDS:2 [Rhizophagus irregularis]